MINVPLKYIRTILRRHHLYDKYNESFYIFADRYKNYREYSIFNSIRHSDFDDLLKVFKIYSIVLIKSNHENYLYEVKYNDSCRIN